MELTARFGRPTDQLTVQYTTPTRRWTTDTKLYAVRRVKLLKLAKEKCSKKQRNWESINLLGIWEIIVDLLVQYIEYNIQEIPAKGIWMNDFHSKLTQFLKLKTWKPKFKRKKKEKKKAVHHVKKKNPVTRAGNLSAKLLLGCLVNLVFDRNTITETLYDRTIARLELQYERKERTPLKHRLCHDPRHQQLQLQLLWYKIQKSHGGSRFQQSIQEFSSCCRNGRCSLTVERIRHELVVMK